MYGEKLTGVLQAPSIVRRLIIVQGVCQVPLCVDTSLQFCDEFFIKKHAFDPLYVSFSFLY
jgi:hypothetical protein